MGKVKCFALSSGIYSPSVAAWPWGLLGLDSPINSVGADLPPGHEKPYHPNNPSPVYFGELGKPYGLMGTSHVWGSSKEVWKIMSSLSTFRMILLHGIVTTETNKIMKASFHLQRNV